jgi:hypothetical protein
MPVSIIDKEGDCLPTGRQASAFPDKFRSHWHSEYRDIIAKHVKNTSRYFTYTKHIQKTPMQILFYIKRKSAA